MRFLSAHGALRSSAWRQWLLALLIQIAVVIVEIIAVNRPDSRALISDALHNSSDVLLLIMTAVPFMLAAKRYPKAQQITQARRASLVVNVVALVGSGLVGIMIGVESLHRLQPVHYDHAWPAAVTSLLGNILIYGVVRPFHHDHGSKVFGWHQLWDVGAALLAAITLWAGSRVNVPQLDSIACIGIGVAMCLHWPMVWLFERNGHHHHHD